MSEAPTPKGVMEKIEFYFLGLTFTLLALAVQTFKPTYSLAADVVEIFGWIALLISGLLGLSKVEWIPVLLHVRGRQSYLEQAQDDLRKTKALGMPVRNSKDGQLVNVSELVAVTAKSLGEVKSYGQILDKKHEIKHVWQKACFFVGLLALLFARAQGVVQRVIERIM